MRVFSRLFSKAAILLAVVTLSGTAVIGTVGTPASAAEKSDSTSPIVIGNIGSYSGPQASSQGGIPLVLKAWQSWTNSHGGLNGHPVHLIIKDLGSNLTGGLQAAQELVQQDHVSAIVSDFDNGDSTWASYIAGTGVPVIGGDAIDLPFVTNADFFPAGTDFFALIYGLEKLASKQGSKLGLLYCAETPQCNTSQIFQAFAKSTGTDVAVTSQVAATQPDYTAVCQQLKSSGVSSYTVVDGAAVVLRVQQDCQAAGLTAKPLSMDGGLTTAWLAKPSATNGVEASEEDAPFFDAAVPATKAYQEAIKKYAPTLGDQNGAASFYAWVGGELFGKAVSMIPSGTAVTPASLKKALYSMKDETIGGLTPPLTFTKGQPTAVNCYFIEGIKDGKFVTPDGLKTQCAPNSLVQGVVAGLTK